MKIIAQTETGFILEASSDDVKHILTATNGSCDLKLVKIGQKIPAIDYSMSISKVNDLSSSYPMKKIKDGLFDLTKALDHVDKLLSSTMIED